MQAIRLKLVLFHGITSRSPQNTMKIQEFSHGVNLEGYKNCLLPVSLKYNLLTLVDSLPAVVYLSFHCFVLMLNV